MSIVNDMSQKVQEFASENATTLLTAGGVVGTVATAVLAGRAGYKYKELVDEAQKEPVPDKDEPHIMRGRPPLTKLEKAQIAGIHFVPPIITGGVTITAIIFANRMSAQKAAALAAAYGLSQKQFEEYRTKVSEKLTGPKKEQLDAELAQERANRAPGSGQIVIVEGGDVLCFDQPTGRYFKSTMEKINQAKNRANEEMLGSDGVSANFFYEELGLPPTTWGDEVGWNAEGGLIELDISTIISPEDEKPCLAIDFKRLPVADYMSRSY